MSGSLTVLADALAYAGHGWPVFPCREHRKAPLTDHGLLDASTDPDQIRRWWARWASANVAIPTGTATIDVLDVDVRPGGNGWKPFNRLKRAGLLRGALATVQTPSGGLHVYYVGTEQRNGSVRGQHIDFRGAGGYVLVPPSHVVTDTYAGTYTVVDDRRRRTDARPLDWAACKRLLDPPRPTTPWRSSSGGTPSLDQLARWLSEQVQGNRNAGLFWSACRALEAGHDDLTQLVDAALRVGLDEQEIADTIRSARRRIGADA